MELERQVTNKKISQRIKELGVKQDSLWYWVNIGNPAGRARWQIQKRLDKPMKCYPHIAGHPDWSIISAFTVAEWGELLPDYYRTFYDGKDWVCHEPSTSVFEIADTEANARGKMRIYLLENKRT